MKYLIASDIHGSDYWCRELLAAWDREEADRLILLGDILYHGPRNALPKEYDPAMVAAQLNARSKRILCVRGNCDSEVDQAVLTFPILAEYALLDLGDRLLFITHGDHYNADALPPLHAGDVLIHGHTHVPTCEEKNGVAVLNPGSVAIPKGDSDFGYMLLEN